MSYEYNDAIRGLRAPERERMLLQEAERLIEQRAAKLHVSPRSLVNALFNEADAKPSPEERQTSSISALLVERLARRDRGSDAD